MKTFAIIVSVGMDTETGEDWFKINVFDVPDEEFSRPGFSNDRELAGWYYMNRLDAFSCTADYKWVVQPLEVFTRSGFTFNGMKVS